MDDSETPNYREVLLRDLRPMDLPMMVVGRVVRAERRVVARRSDERSRPVLSGLLSDGTATVRFTWWDPPEEGIEPGTILRAANILVREYRGRPELSFTSRTRVVPADASELPPTTGTEIPLVRAADMRPGSEGFRLEVRVVAVRTKAVTVRGEVRTIFEGAVADPSGTLPFTAWSDLHLREGESVRITGAVGREFRGRPQLSLDDRCVIEILRDAVPGPPPAPGPSTIGGLVPTVGDPTATLEGTVVAILAPSGVVYRCPECRRTLASGTCRTHGTVVGTPDLRARFVVDDGTGSATVELGRAAVESMLGRNLAEWLSGGGEPSPSAEADLTARWFGRHVRAFGRVVQNDFGLTVFAEAPVEEVASASIPVETLRAALAELAP